MNEGNERRNAAAEGTNEGLSLSREESKALAGAVLDALGVDDVEIDEEELEAIRRAVDDWKRRRDERRRYST